MNDKYLKVTELLKTIQSYDHETQLAIWTGLTTQLSITHPNEFFYVMRNSIKHPFTSPDFSVNFGNIAAAVYFSLQQDIFNDPKYLVFYNSLQQDN